MKLGVRLGSIILPMGEPTLLAGAHEPQAGLEMFQEWCAPHPEASPCSARHSSKAPEDLYLCAG
eukprot:104883-Amphidinium_carterae.2